MSEFGGEIAGGGIAAADQYIPGLETKPGPIYNLFVGSAFPFPWQIVGTGTLTWPNRSTGGAAMAVVSPGNKFNFVKIGRYVCDPLEPIIFEAVLSSTLGASHNTHIGMADSALTVINDFDNNASKFIDLRINASTFTIRMKSGDGVARTELDTLKVVDTLTHTYRLELKSGEFKAYQDGILLGTKTDRIPPDGTFMDPFVEPTNNGGSSTIILYALSLGYTVFNSP